MTRFMSAGASVRVIAAGGAVLRTRSRDRVGSNPFCAGFQPHGPEITRRAADAGDSRSVSLLLTYGKVPNRHHGGPDLEQGIRPDVPGESPGQAVDVYLVSHHGSDTSGSAALVHALRPRVAIMNNGPRKGGAIQTFQILGASPGLEDLWQSHYSIPGGSQHNRPEAFIANLDEGSDAGRCGSGGRARSHGRGPLDQDDSQRGRRIYDHQQPNRFHEALPTATESGGPRAVGDHARLRGFGPCTGESTSP